MSTDTETQIDVENMSNADLVPPSKIEHAAQKEAKAAGTPIPPSPHLDELNRRYAAGVNKKTKSNGKVAAPKVAQHFFRNGKPMPASQDSLSSLAYQSTRDVKRDAARITTDELIALLGKAGVKDPKSTSWDVELPNGQLIAARVAGDSTPVVQPKPATKPATKPAASKAAAAKRSKPAAPAKRPAKKTSAKRSAPAKRQAKGPVKSSAAKRPAKK